MGRTIIPLKNKLVIKQVAPKSEKNGIILPQGKEIYDNMGIVEVVGPDVKDVAVGDKVIFTRKPASALFERAGDEFENLLMLTEDDIVAVVTE